MGVVIAVVAIFISGSATSSLADASQRLQPLTSTCIPRCGLYAPLAWAPRRKPGSLGRYGGARLHWLAGASPDDDDEDATTAAAADD